MLAVCDFALILKIVSVSDHVGAWSWGHDFVHGLAPGCENEYGIQLAKEVMFVDLTASLYDLMKMYVLLQMNMTGQQMNMAVYVYPLL